MIKNTPKTLFLLTILALSGCASMDLKTVKESRPIYDKLVSGQQSIVAGCVADALQTNESWSIRSLHYTVRNYPEVDKSSIQAFMPNMYGSPLFIFLLDFAQKESNSVHVELRAVVREYNPYIDKAILSCSTA